MKKFFLIWYQKPNQSRPKSAVVYAIDHATACEKLQAREPEATLTGQIATAPADGFRNSSTGIAFTTPDGKVIPQSGCNVLSLLTPSDRAELAEDALELEEV